MSERDLLPHHGGLKKLFSPPVEILTITLRVKQDSNNSEIKINDHLVKGSLPETMKIILDYI